MKSGTTTPLGERREKITVIRFQSTGISHPVLSQQGSGIGSIKDVALTFRVYL